MTRKRDNNGDRKRNRGRRGKNGQGRNGGHRGNENRGPIVQQVRLITGPHHHRMENMNRREGNEDRNGRRVESPRDWNREKERRPSPRPVSRGSENSRSWNNRPNFHHETEYRARSPFSHYNARFDRSNSCSPQSARSNVGNAAYRRSNSPQSPYVDSSNRRRPDSRQELYHDDNHAQLDGYDRYERSFSRLSNGTRGQSSNQDEPRSQNRMNAQVTPAGNEVAKMSSKSEPIRWKPRSTLSSHGWKVECDCGVHPTHKQECASDACKRHLEAYKEIPFGQKKPSLRNWDFLYPSAGYLNSFQRFGCFRVCPEELGRMVQSLLFCRSNLKQVSAFTKQFMDVPEVAEAMKKSSQEDFEYLQKTIHHVQEVFQNAGIWTKQ